MKRKSGVLLSTTGVVALTGLAIGYWHFGAPETVATESVALASTAPTVPAALPDAAPAADAAPVAPAPATTANTTAPDPLAPSFDVIRVEPDGATLIAGRMEPDTALRILDGERVVAQGRSNAQGEFALTLPQNLAIGDHELRLVAGEGDGERLSEQRAVISVPMPGRESELLVMLEAPDAPSRLIAAPRTGQALEVAAAQTPAAAAEPPMPSQDKAARVAAAANPDAPAIGAVEIEGDHLFIAGTAKAGQKVRLYLNDAFVAETAVGDKKEFLASATQDVPVGQHVVRADVLDRAGNVVSRAEVPFSRPDGERVAAVAASPALPGMSAAEKLDPSIAREADGADGALQPVDGRVIIRKGDTLWRISRENYGSGSRYTVIYLANGDQIRNPDLIYPGQIFRMPVTNEAAGG